MKVPVIFLKILLLFSTSTFVRTLECDHFYSEVLDNHGFISSFNYPFEYRNNLACRYTFYMKNRDPNLIAASKICFKFYEFDLEQNVPFCLFDFLEFHATPPIKYCSNGVWQYGVADPDYPQSTLTSGYSCWNLKNSDDTFLLKFSSDNSSSGRGFYAKFQILQSFLPKPSVDQGASIGKPIMKCSFSWKNSEGDMDSGGCSLDLEGWKKTDGLLVGSKYIGDHTVGIGGSFLLSSKNMKSQLLLPEIILNSDLQYCLTFWYFFVDVHSPGVKVFISKDQMHEYSEWEAIPSNSTPSWRLAEISLLKLPSIQVAIATDVPDHHWPEGSLGVVAIDDLAIVAGSCSGADVSCNFESSNCDWTSPRELVHLDGTLTANGDWRRMAGGGSLEFHEDVKGNYISTLTVNDGMLSRSLLVSPQVTSSLNSVDLGQVDDDSSQDHHHACFKFFYRFGEDGGLSRLNGRLIGHDGHLTPPMWSATNRERGKWVSAMADLVLIRDRPYKIIFEALMRAGSYVSLDGFSLDRGGCPTPTSECLSTNGQQCGSGLCVEASAVCDGRDDCEDGSDEDETTGCQGRRQQSTVVSTDLSSSEKSEASGGSANNGVDVVAASICSAVIVIVIITCLILTMICLARKKKIKSIQRSINMPDKNRNGVNKGVCNLDEETTIYQTLSTSNQSSANLCWVNGEEQRTLRIARSSSSSDEGSDLAIANINDPHYNSTARFDRTLGSCQPPNSAFRSLKREAEPATNVLDAKALRGHDPAPLIVASKYIISPDRVGAFVPGLTDRQRIDRMIESYRKDIKIPNTNTSSLFDRSFEASKEFQKNSESRPPSDHVYEDIDEAKVGLGVKLRPSEVMHRAGERECPVMTENKSRGNAEDRTEGSIIGRAILV